MSVCFILILASVLAINAEAEEPPAPPLSLFVLPGATLKSSVETNQVSPKTKASATNAPQAGEFTATTEKATASVTESSVQAFESMNGQAVLTSVERPEELGGAAGWLSENVWDPVFAPEIIKVGKVKMTGGIIAAVKRKNPFCLLNPLVFAASW
jgi:hypothetical protein